MTAVVIGSCEMCGGPTQRKSGGKPPRFCSIACNELNRRGRRRSGLSTASASCANCAKPIDRATGRWKYCSLECVQASRRKFGEHRFLTCKNCKKEFIAGKRGPAALYCSIECRLSWISVYGDMPECRWCKREFTPVAQETYCSKKCRRSSRIDQLTVVVERRKQSVPKRTCLVCGQELARCAEKFCGKKCQGLSERRQDYTCQQCGVAYRAKASNRRSFCSRECFFTSVKKAPSPPKLCLVCSAPIAKNRHSVYCSDECRKNKARQDSRIRNSKKKRMTERLCAECGVAFVPQYGDKRRVFCSDKCLKKHSKRITKAARRARERKLPHETIDPMDVFKRAMWRCYLCGRATLPTLRGTTDPLAPELDHIVPLAMGGAHILTNVACTCRECNQAKGAAVLGQLRMAV